MLAYLVDESISYVIAEQIVRQNAAITAQSVFRWEGGEYVGETDDCLFCAARDEGLTLVTYDIKTIPKLAAELAAEGESHAGILFVDLSSIRSSDFGGLVRALLAHWQRYSAESWTDRVAFLEPI